MTKYLGLFLFLSTSFAWAMEKQAHSSTVTSLVSIAPKQFGILNNNIDGYLHALRDFAQLLYYQHCRMFADKALWKLMDIVQASKSYSLDMSSLAEDSLQRFDKILEDAHVSLLVMQSYTVSDEIDRIMRCIKDLQECNRSAVKEQQGSKIEIEIKNNGMKARKMFDDEYESLHIPETYAMTVRTLKRLILRHVQKDKNENKNLSRHSKKTTKKKIMEEEGLHQYSKTTKGEILPLELPPEEAVSQEEKAVNNASISAVTNQTTGKKKKRNRNRRRRKNGTVQDLHPEDTVESDVQPLEELQ